jgi:shikimate kinase
MFDGFFPGGVAGLDVNRLLVTARCDLVNSRFGIALSGLADLGQGKAHPGGTAVRVFLTGVSCVGKTTVGMKLAKLLSVAFFDVDEEIEAFFGTTIERLQSRFVTMHSFRNEAAKALIHVMTRLDSRDSVIALPPSGLVGAYWQAVKKSTGITVALHDRPENILERITFYDVDSKPIERDLTRDEKQLYLREIRKDIAYFAKTYERAHLNVDISGMDVDAAARKVKETLDVFTQRVRRQSKSERRGGRAR